MKNSKMVCLALMVLVVLMLSASVEAGTLTKCAVTQTIDVGKYIVCENSGGGGNEPLHVKMFIEDEMWKISDKDISDKDVSKLSGSTYTPSANNPNGGTVTSKVLRTKQPGIKTTEQDDAIYKQVIPEVTQVSSESAKETQEVVESLQKYAANKKLYDAALDIGLDIEDLNDKSSDKIKKMIAEKNSLNALAEDLGLKSPSQKNTRDLSNEIKSKVKKQNSEFQRYGLTGITEDLSNWVNNVDVRNKIKMIYQAKELGITVPNDVFKKDNAKLYGKLKDRITIVTKAKDLGVNLGDSFDVNGNLDALKKEVAARQNAYNLMISSGTNERIARETLSNTANLKDLNAKVAMETVDWFNPKEVLNTITSDERVNVEYLDVYIDNEGKVLASTFVGEGKDAKQYIVDTGWTAEGVECGVAGCSIAEAIDKGVVFKDKSGRGYTVEMEYYVNGKKVSAAECTKNPGKCKSLPGNKKEAGNAYWQPATWADWIFGGPAVMGMKSLSSLIGHQWYADWWNAFWDRYFNFESLVTTSFCEAVHSVEARGVGISPYGSGMPTAMIQAQKWKVMPCNDLSGGARSSCLLNQSLTETKDYFWVYRITGKLIPKDCGMKFNIYLQGDGIEKKIFKTTRRADRGSIPFDLSGANAIVTTNKELPEYSKICIRFENDISNCFMHASPFDKNKALCNKVYDAGEDYVIQRATIDESTGEVVTGGGGPQTSSNREGLTV